MSKRFLLRFFICVLLLFAIRKSLDLVFGMILEQVFANGTKCEVSLFNPRLSLFPLRGDVDNVIIRHPSEPADAGFRAKHISIRLHFLRMFRKELLLSDLELTGATANSIGTDTGFIQTFAFLFPPKDPNAPPKEHGAFVRWLQGWDFHVSTIRISSDARHDQLVIGFGGQTFSWDKVDVDFEEQDWDSKKPYNLKATGTNFRLSKPESPRFFLGELNGRGQIGLGKLVLAQASVADPANSQSRAHAAGTIILGAPGKYDLTLAAELQSEYLHNALSELPLREQNLPKSLTFSGELHGEFVDPNLRGTIAVQFDEGTMLSARSECGLKNAAATLDLSPERLRVMEVRIEDIVKTGEVTLELGGQEKVDGELEVTLDRDRRWVKECFIQAAAKNDPGVERAIGESLADSFTRVTISGGLQPRDLLFDIQSDISLRDRSVQTKLTATARLDDKALDVKVNETGSVPQIQVEKSAPAAGGDEPERQTTFRRVEHSNIGVDARLDIETGKVELRTVEVQSFPTQRLLARFSPFLSAEAYRRIRAFPAETSRVDVRLQGSFSPDGASTSVGGKVSVTDLDLFGIPTERVSIPVHIEKTKFGVKAASVETLEGALRANVEGDLGTGEVRGDLVADGVELSSLPGWKQASTDWRTLIAGSLELAGTFSRPEYRGRLELETARKGEANTIRRSTVEIKGNDAQLDVKGRLLGSADLQLSYPFQDSAGGQMELVLTARDFPLDYALGEIHDPVESTVTGTFRFRGPRKDPLLGEGLVQVQKLRFVSGKLVVVEDGPLEATLRGERLSFTRVHVKAGDRAVALSGYVDQREGWQASLDGAWELGTFVPSYELIEQVSGDLSVNIDVRGPLRSPTLSGPVTLEHASVTFPLGLTIVGVSDLRAEAIFDGDALNIREISGSVGGAPLSGHGEIRKLFDSDERALRANVEFRNVTVEPVEHLTAELDGQLELSQQGTDVPTLSGDLLVRSGQYENIIKLGQVVSAATRVIRGRSDTAARTVRREGEGMRFDLAMRAPSGFLVETNVVEAELRSDMRLTGTLASPKLEGKIEAVEGSFGLQANEFDLVSGRLLFSPTATSLDPRLYILGESTAVSRSGEEHHVRLTISGTLTQPEVSFSSDSGLRQEEILAMVGFGASIQPFEILRGGRRTKSFAELVNPTTGASLGDRLSGLTKFSSVQIDTGLSPTTGEFVPRLIAKRPLVRGVDLELKSELSGNQASSVDLDYPLTPYLSIIGGWRTRPVTTDASTSSGSFSVGLHYRSTFPGFRLFSPELRRQVTR